MLLLLQILGGIFAAAAGIVGAWGLVRLAQREMVAIGLLVYAASLALAAWLLLNG